MDISPLGYYALFFCSRLRRTRICLVDRHCCHCQLQIRHRVATQEVDEQCAIIRQTFTHHQLVRPLIDTLNEFLVTHLDHEVGRDRRNLFLELIDQRLARVVRAVEPLCLVLGTEVKLQLVVVVVDVVVPKLLPCGNDEIVGSFAIIS